MFIAKTLSFYKRADVQEALVQQATDREIAIKFQTFFGKRPDTLVYPNDVMEFAKKKASSFHCSEERWNNPLLLNPNMSKQEQTDLRSGWDLVLDIDCAFLEYSKIAAHYVIKILQHHNIKSVSCKFSGNKGFHIAVPFECFPDTWQGQPTKEMFPEIPRRIAAYIKEMIKDSVSRDILKLEQNDFSIILKKTGLSPEKITRYTENEAGQQVPTLNAEPFLDIDTILISSRHLFRMAYSFHEKSELVSVPIDPNTVLSFSKEQAKHENIKEVLPFLDRNVTKSEATNLLTQAYDFLPEIQEEEDKKELVYEVPEEALPKEAFPPCMQIALKGLKDGKKRFLFALLNFLECAGWNKEMVEKLVREWNTKNPEPLREVYIKGQLRYREFRKKAIPPPKCRSFYQDLQICRPDNLCNKITNPASYVKRKAGQKKNK